jgi:hypothetical protein
MIPLLELALDAHGGLTRWRNMRLKDKKMRNSPSTAAWVTHSQRPWHERRKFIHHIINLKKEF